MLPRDPLLPAMHPLPVTPISNYGDILLPEGGAPLVVRGGVFAKNRVMPAIRCALLTLVPSTRLRCSHMLHALFTAHRYITADGSHAVGTISEHDPASDMFTVIRWPRVGDLLNTDLIRAS